MRLSEVERDEMLSQMTKNHLSIARALEYLEERLQTLEDSQKRLVFRDIGQVDNQRFDDSEFSVPVEDSLYFDTQHGTVTLPKVEEASISKLIFTNSNNEEVVPSGFQHRVIGKNNTADHSSAYVETSSVEHALYRRPGFTWERNIVSSAPNINGAEMTVYMRLPDDLFAIDTVNSMLLHGFPHFGVTLKEISYTTIVNPSLSENDGYIPFNEDGHHAGDENAVGWVMPGGWSGQFATTDQIDNAGPRHFVFEPKPITAVKIVLAQDGHYEEAERYIYSYGMSRFDLRYDKFLPEGRALIRFDAPVGETISGILNVIPEMWNVPPELQSTVFENRVIWETFPGSEEPTLEPQPNSSRVWLEITMKNTPNWSPVLSGLVVDYIPGEITIGGSSFYDGGFADTDLSTSVDGGLA